MKLVGLIDFKNNKVLSNEKNLCFEFSQNLECYKLVVYKKEKVSEDNQELKHANEKIKQHPSNSESFIFIYKSDLEFLIKKNIPFDCSQQPKIFLLINSISGEVVTTKYNINQIEYIEPYSI